MHVNSDKTIHNRTHKKNFHTAMDFVKVEVSHAGKYPDPSMYLRVPWAYWNQFDQCHRNHLKQSSINGIWHKMFLIHNTFCVTAVSVLMFWVDKLRYWINEIVNTRDIHFLYTFIYLLQNIFNLRKANKCLTQMLSCKSWASDSWSLKMHSERSSIFSSVLSLIMPQKCETRRP